MSRSFSSGSHLVLLALIASLVLAATSLAVETLSASAATLLATCGTLQATMQASSEHAKQGEGDVILLGELCNPAGYTIPPGSNFTIEGVGAAGFDGKGGSESLLTTSGAAGSLTLTNLVFEHAKNTSKSALSLVAARVTLRGDSFIESSSATGGGAGGGGAASITIPENASCGSVSGPTAVTITDSMFSRDTLTQAAWGGGGALLIEQDCPAASTVLERNTFQNNRHEGEGSYLLYGGALSVINNDEKSLPSLPAPLLQRGNVFDSNSVIANPAGSENRGGGGEWLEGMNLTSVGDRFTRNSIPGVTGAGWSWGGGLGILNTGCNTTTATESTLENAVVAGNSIGAGTGEVGGAGIYIGCDAEPKHPNHLNLFDSTVTENTLVSGGGAGIDGGSEDHLTIANSIVANDSVGSEIGGFNGSGGALTATFSDVCNGAGSSPLPGTGNICANPLLADNGNTSSTDVDETASSPTIDAGSNALVPSGLTTDAFGTTRILAGHAVCTGEVPKVVDMGAAEFSPAIPPCAPPVTIGKSAPPPSPGLTQFVSLKTSSTGVALRLSCSSTDGRGCSGTIYVTLNETLKGKKVVAVSAAKRTEVPVRIAQASFSLPAGGSATFPAKLNSAGKALLRRFHAISAFVLANEASPTSTPFIFLLHTVRFIEPKKHKSKHKSPHSKRH